MLTTYLTVAAVEPGLVPIVDADGAIVMGRYVGRDKLGRALPDGERLPDSSYLRRMLAEGSLELLAEETG